MKDLPEPSKGGTWVVEKNGQGIPYVHDEKGKVKRWCMAFFQKRGVDTDADEQVVALPDLDTVGDAAVEPASASPEAVAKAKSAPAALPGAVASTGNSDPNLIVVAFFCVVLMGVAEHWVGLCVIA